MGGRITAVNPADTFSKTRFPACSTGWGGVILPSGFFLMAVKDKKILVGLTGGIACYKVPYLIRLLTKNGAAVRVVMTQAATRFITPLTLETVSNNPVSVEMFPEHRFVATHHIDLADWPDLVVVAPATANFLGKIASGISDDLLTTLICATPRPVMIAPAMNPHMWSNKVTQKNYAYLKQLGYLFVEPEEGEMACEEAGVGRMAEPEHIFDAIKRFFARTSRKILVGKKVVVTAGPTRERLDPVRFLTNHSTGKMGFALAEAAQALGAETTLISGPTHLTPAADVRFVSVESTAELFRAVKKAFKNAHCLIMAAAPADFKPSVKAAQKMKKNRLADSNLVLTLEPTVDILKEIGKFKKPGQLVVGFALETEDAVSNARQKLKEKNLDMIVVNQPGAKTGFESDTNQVMILRPGRKPEQWPLMSKREIAFKLLEKIAGSLEKVAGTL
jgi:phosphopantothenoylcysteine decarboxylase/phosphopantothenate--cysteine ligase